MAAYPGVLSNGPQTATTIRPSGFATRRISRSALVGSSKNMKSELAYDPVKDAGGKWQRLCGAILPANCGR